MLLFVKAFAESTPGRAFAITNLARHNSVVHALLIAGDSLYHKPNPDLEKAQAALATGGRDGGYCGYGGAGGGDGGGGGAGDRGVVWRDRRGADGGRRRSDGVVSGRDCWLVCGDRDVYIYNLSWWRDKTMFADPEKKGCQAICVFTAGQ
jgi:hypothetical protein